MLIGIAGYAGSGKDTVGKILVENHGFRRIGFADKVKELALRIDPVIWDNEGELDVPLSWFVELLGWEDAKKDRQVRELLQRIGEGVRKTLSDDAWIDAALKDIGYGEDVVITDVRYPNELEMIEEMGGTSWWVSRTGVGPVNDHASENSISSEDCDLIIGNHSSLGSLEKSVNGHILLRRTFG